MIKDRVVIDEFIEWLCRIRSLTVMTVGHNRSVCRAWADFLEQRGETSVRNARVESVLAYVEKRSSVDRVKDVTVSDDLCILRTLYNYLVAFGGSTNPTACLPEFVCKKDYESDYLTVDEMFAMLDTCDMNDPQGLRDYCIIAFLWSTGLRTAEFLALRWRDIDLEEGTVLVRKGKGQKQRSLFLNELLYRKGVSWTRVFADLEKTLPPNVRLILIRPQVFSESQVHLEMVVAAESPGPVFEALRALESSEVFGETNVYNFIQPSQSEPLFRCRMSVNYVQKL